MVAMLGLLCCCGDGCYVVLCCCVGGCYVVLCCCVDGCYVVLCCCVVIVVLLCRWLLCCHCCVSV